MNGRLRDWAKRLKRNIVMLWFARLHPDAPLPAKILCIVAVLYTLSPIDLVPDFIPVLGYLDDILLVPALIWLAIRTLPPRVVQVCREQAQKWMDRQGARPKSRLGAVIVIAVWVLVAYLCWHWLMP
jgi:uncharacterized membrane protein YkvA (DUF1232 family)